MVSFAHSDRVYPPPDPTDQAVFIDFDVPEYRTMHRYLSMIDLGPISKDAGCLVAKSG